MLRVAGRRLSSLSWRSGQASPAAFVSTNPLAGVGSPDTSFTHINPFSDQIRASMASSTSSSAVAWLSRSAASHGLIAPNEFKFSIPRPYSTAAATSQIPGAKGGKIVDKSPNWAAMIARAPNRTLWHIYDGMEEILLDYVHQETTRALVLVLFKLFLIIAIKDAFLALAHF